VTSNVSRATAARIAATAAVVVVAVVLVAGLTRGAQRTASTTSTAAEAWSLPRLDRPGLVRLSDFRGTPLVVDFFASWCTACRDELPELLSVSRQTGRRVHFVGVDSQETGDGLAMARRYGITAWPLARDVDGTDQSGVRDTVLSVAGMPAIAFYDSRGHLVASRLGAVSADTLRALIRQYFGVSL
jgi:thiol-disulfide isomerase/thioredoxin